MHHIASARRVLTAALATTLLAGGVLLGQTVTAEPAAAGTITCNINQLKADARKQRDRAAQLKRLGAHTEARKALAKADALERRAQQCADADNNSKPPLWK
ncbi:MULTISPECIES: hypothetical protein [Streptomyces]|uniref:Secreted protein n=1 Tax=Streptomyces venezuelae (strain ATCC 10712 / CBS 650.69 / DSM 40230 / JCM 4526 / NBRC 13096 / PD 04745) TaxID=953739 RepID=F2RF23_STRVP|nr:hypothetical protein [Streptomyces venezuelae]APE25145.1 hypothetical protein vnz_31680 [Streptomyces venezuelae]QES02488.1 hypothetical protein DEJ43_32180 [Streptomyces venezuelae ATCC 10712]QES09475.1 hypothetical protein DEJ44_30135 [Streptomyces venezuelae]QES11868.1 hypothetical protein DEJ45_05315 [Streptomyces venezuelae]CCA59708.1 hypothetical protein SVEN_6422 [Streptomyces venezuelae ATCC 10712]